jgi:hypothetical protein
LCPPFFAKGLNINSKEYVKVLKKLVKPWMDGVAPRHHYSTSFSRMVPLPTTPK